MTQAEEIVDVLLEEEGTDLEAFVRGAGVMSPGLKVSEAWKAAQHAHFLDNQADPHRAGRDWFYTPTTMFGPGRYEVHSCLSKGKAYVEVTASLPDHLKSAFNIYDGLQSADFRRKIAVPLDAEEVRKAADKLYAWTTREMQKWDDLAYCRRSFKRLSPQTGKQIGNEFRSVFTEHRGMAGFEHNGYIKSDIKNDEAARMRAWMQARLAQIGIRESFDPEEFVASSGVAPGAESFRFVRETGEPGETNYGIYVTLAKDPWNEKSDMHIGEIVKHDTLESDWGIAGGAAFGPATSAPYFNTPDWERRFSSKEAAALYLWSLRRFSVGESDEGGIDMDKFLKDAGVTVDMDDFYYETRQIGSPGAWTGNHRYSIYYKRLLYKGKPVYLGSCTGSHDYNRTGHSGAVHWSVDVPRRSWMYDPRDKQGRRVYRDPKLRGNYGYGNVHMNAPGSYREFSGLFDCAKYLLSLLKIQHPLRQAESLEEAYDSMLQDLGSIATDPILIPQKVKVDFLTADQEAGIFYFTVSLLRSRHSYRHFLGTLKRHPDGQWSIENTPEVVLRKRIEPYPNPDEKFDTDLAAERALIRHIIRQFPGLLTPRW